MDTIPDERVVEKSESQKLMVWFLPPNMSITPKGPVGPTTFTDDKIHWSVAES